MIDALIISRSDRRAETLHRAVETAGASPRTVESIADAIESLQEQSFQLVFFEERGDEIGGEPAVQLIREAAAPNDVRVIAIPSEIAFSKQGLAGAGFDDILRLPLDSLDLSLLVNSVARSIDTRAALVPDRPSPDATILRQLSLDLAWSTTLKQQAHHGVNAACKLLRTFRGAVWLRNSQDRTLECIASAGLSERYPIDGAADFNYWSQADWVDLSRRPQYSENALDGTGTTPDLALNENISNTLTAALFTPSEVIGALVLFDLPLMDGGITEDELQLIDTITANTAMALDQTRLRFDLSNSESTYRQLVEEMPNGVFVHDGQGNFLMSNSAIESICGYSGDELALMNLFDLLLGGPDGEDASVLDSVLEEITGLEDDDLGSTEMFGPLNLNLVAADGRRIEAELYFRPLQLHGRSGEIWIQAMARDVTTEARTSRALEALRGVAECLSSSGDDFQALRQVLAEIERSVAYLHASIWQLSTEPDELLCAAQRGRESDYLTADPSDGIIGQVLGSTVPRHLTNLAEYPEFEAVDDDVTEVAAIPILADEQPLGVLYIQTGQDRRLSFGDIDFLESVCAQLAGRMARSKATQETTAHSDHDAIVGATSRSAFVEKLATNIHPASSQTDSLLFIGIDGFRFFNRTYGHRVGDDLLRQVYAAVRRQLSSGAELGRVSGDEFCALLPGVNRTEALQTAEEIRIAIATQLFQAGEQLEHVTISVGAATAPDDAQGADPLLVAASDAAALASIAGGNQVFQTNAALSQLSLQYDQLSKSLRSFPHQSLSMLVQAMDERIPERQGHPSRVAALAKAIGERLGFATSVLAHIEISAQIHELGMLLISDKRLRAPIDLSDEDQMFDALIPAVAGRLLSDVTVEAPVRLAVIHQYEHWDGSGYPARLQGSSIPIAARIIAVADTIDRLKHPSGSQTPMTIAGIQGELERASGSRFDPTVVTAASAVANETLVERGRAVSLG